MLNKKERLFQMRLQLRIVLLVVSACLLLSCAAPASTQITLNGSWQFRVDPAGRGQAEGWSKTLPDGTRTVRVPNTWNVGEFEDYEGIAWYFKTIDLPSELKGKHLEIHFAATFYSARIWLNGIELGSHAGGHTSYFFVLPANLPAKNFLAIAIDNRPTAQSIPGLALRNKDNLWYDWWHYGGIVRDVWLTANDSVFLRRQHVRVEVQGQDALVTDRLFLESFSSRALPVRLKLRARLERGSASPVAEVERSVVLGPRPQEIEIKFKIPSARLWSFDEPNLYDLDTVVQDAAGKDLDSRTDHFGARSIEIRNQKLYLNGEPVRLTGMTRHEDSPGEGLAETAGTWQRDYDDMKNLQVVLTRPVHYPQLEAILDYCDRNGILLVPEIPLWQFGHSQLGDPEVRALAKAMFREMVDQDFNHPSIFAWSVCNECEIHSAEGIDYFKQMRDWSKSLDPDRYVTFADDLLPLVQDPLKSATQFADFIMWNQYFGTWHGPANWLPAVMDRIHANFPGKMAIISEFGVPGVFAADSQQGDQLRSRIIHEQLTELAKHDWIAGAIFWCYQDYRSHRNLWPGLTRGYVDHGVVDENRQRRPSYDVWREETSPVRLQIDWTRDSAYPFVPVGFTAQIDRRPAGDLPSYSLHDYHAVWELRDEQNKLLQRGENKLGEIGSPVQIAQPFLKPASLSWTLRLDVYRPTGFLALRREITWRDVQPGGEDRKDMERKTKPSSPPSNPASSASETPH